MEVNIKKLIVKIQYMNNHGSGMLFSLSGNDEEDLILTVFHIFEGFTGDTKKIKIESVFDHAIPFNVRRVLYEKSDCNKYDLALIYVDKIKQITPDDNMMIPDKNATITNTQVYIAGFPLGIQDLDMPYLPLYGVVSGYTDEDNCRYMIKLDNPIEPGSYLYESIKGMSGSPVYCCKENQMFFLGVQKNVPSKEVSYYIANAITYKWYLDAVSRLYQIDIPFRRASDKKEQDDHLILFKAYFNHSKEQSGTYFLKQINKKLFPEIANDLGVKYFNNKQQEVALITYLNECWNSETSRHKGLLITGEGGSGKTVSLLETCEYCLNNDIFATYIPLHLLTDDRCSTIKEYLEDYIWNGSESFADSFINSLNGRTNRQKPCFVLLLDGFNEIVEGNNVSVIRDIEKWINQPNVQIIITSRYNFKKNNAWLPQMEHLNIQPLKIAQINEYLQYCGVEIPQNKELMKLLEIPMLLTLYANTEGQHLNNKMTKGLIWKEERVNTGTIIWNYLQCQLIKPMTNRFSGNEILNYVYAMEYITPYIGYKMEQKSLFSIDDEDFFDWIEAANSYYHDLWEQNYPVRIKRLERSYSCKNSEWNSQRLYTILIRELHIFVLSVNNTVSLLHQQFRDFFSANYYIESMHNSPTCIEVFGKAPIDYYVVNLISEIADGQLLSKAWEEMRNSQIINCKYVCLNMLKIYRCIKRNDLGEIDFTEICFDRVDLRKVSLQGTKISSYEKKSSFVNSAISEETFYTEGHSGSVYCIAYSPDGRRVLSGSSDKTIREWDLATGECINLLVGNTLYIECVAYSPNGKQALSGTYDGKLLEWDLTTGKIIQSLEGHLKAVYSVKYSFDGTKAISGSYDKTLREWNIYDGKCTQVIECENRGIRSVDYSPDGTKAVTGSYDGKVREWDLIKAAPIHLLPGHKGPVRSVCYSKDGKRIISCSDDQSIREWDLGTGKTTHILKGHTGRVVDVAYSPDSSKALSCSYDNTIREWDLISGECLNILAQNCNVYCVEYSLDGKRALSGGTDLSVKEWELCTGEKSLIIKGYFKNNFELKRGILQDEFGLMYCTNNYELTISVWDFAERKCIHMLNLMLDTDALFMSVVCIAFCQNEFKALFKGLTSSGGVDCIEELNIRTGTCIQKIYSDFGNLGCYSSDGKKALVISKDELTIEEWNLERGNLTQVLKGHTKAINMLHYVDNDRKAFSCSDDKSIIEWDLLSGTSEVIYKGNKEINTILFSHDETILVSCSSDGKIIEWDLKSKRIKRKLGKCIGEIPGLALSTKGEKLLLWKASGEIEEWNLTSCEAIEKNILNTNCDTYQKKREGIYKAWGFKPKLHIQYLRDGSEVAMCSDDGEISVWSADLKECIWSSQYVPAMNVLECDFRNAEFTSIALKNLIKTLGGIVE